ncbi:MAG: hypothetical protein EP335_09340 [Alphaproteobacteria bacterium]|nr:MAG: hypothetical protein EP335_09340 [Alphaproteobacteria bacterium]
MKKVTIESVTGQKAAPKAYEPILEAQPMPVRPRSKASELDEAANKATHAIMACFIVSGLFVLNALLMAGTDVPIGFVAAEAESVASLVLMAVAMAGCGVLGLKRWRGALVAALVLYGLQSLWVLWLLYSFGDTISTSGAGLGLMIGRSLLVRGAILGVIYRGIDGLNSYYRLRDTMVTQGAAS